MRTSVLLAALALASPVPPAPASGAAAGYTASLTRGMSPRAIAVDARGRAVVAGVSGARAFVRKLSADGRTAVFTAWLGAARGYTRTEATAVAVDRSGNVYVTGRTNQKAFRVTRGAFRDTDAFAQDGAAAFVVKLSSETGAVLYSAIVIGGTGRGIGVDFAGRAWVAGTTGDARLTTSADAFQSTAPNDASGFLIGLAADGRHLLYATYIGAPDAPTAIDAVAVDAGGNVSLVGTTSSSAFPTRNALQVTANASADCANPSDAFAMKFGADHKVAYSTLLGGGCRDEATAVATDLAGGVYVAGWTNSTDFPCRHGFQCDAPPDKAPRPPAAFVAKIAADGRALAYSFLLNGRSGESRATSMAVSQASAVVAGWTTAPDFPRQGTWPTASDQARVGGSRDLFVARVSETGDELDYAHALGRMPEPRVAAITAGSAADLYVTGVADGPFVMRLVSDRFQATGRSTAPASSAGDAPSGRRSRQR